MMSNTVAIVTPGQLHAEQLAGKSPALVDVRTAAPGTGTRTARNTRTRNHPDITKE